MSHDVKRKKVNFIYNWNNLKEIDRKLAWSGTPYGLYSALQAMVDVNDISLVDNIFEKILRFGVRATNKIFHMSDFNIVNTKIEEGQVNRSKILSGAPCITFLEYNSRYAKDTYVYQDCSADYFARLVTEEPELVSQRTFPQIVLGKRCNMTAKFYNTCRGVFTMSEWLTKDLVENVGLPAEKVHCVRGGSNMDFTKYKGSDKNGKRFLYVGKDWKRKNGPLVIQAFESLERKYSGVELYIAGPMEKPKFHSNQVHFLGRLSYEEVVDYYNLCDYFVMPSKFEPYGIVFVEALIFGLPCIGKRCFAMPEFIQEDVNGYLLSEDNAEELCRLMECMMINQGRLKENCLQNQEDYINFYTWNSVAERIIDVMKKDGYNI